MHQHQLSLVHAVRSPRTAANSPPLLILVHGIGTNEQEQLRFTQHFDDRFLTISVRAPYVFEPGSYMWFEMNTLASDVVINAAQLQASRTMLIRFVEQAVESYQVDRHHVYLLGFSQGAIIAASLALMRPDTISGAVLVGGVVLPELQATVAEAERLAELPVLHIHGVYDTVVPIHWARASRDWLRRFVRLTYREYPMGHEISLPSLADIGVWLSERLNELTAHPTHASRQ